MKENINKDQEQFTIDSIRGNCFWGHKWTTWRQYRQPIIDRKTRINTYEYRQRRFCLKCGKMQNELIY